MQCGRATLLKIVALWKKTPGLTTCQLFSNIVFCLSWSHNKFYSEEGRAQLEKKSNLENKRCFQL